ncbi:hypothetical protein BKA70DRAFT_1287911 [Coprinopsis sp. MPI-PUGE-AT-0042]|nr:hypothetical protein BKA70DRAFT_1287911 [Coprinopsis sp. MPI-PUGE-AT-0042]
MRLQHHALFVLSLSLATAESVLSALPDSCGLPVQSSASAGVAAHPPCGSDTRIPRHPLPTAPSTLTNPPPGIALETVAGSSRPLPSRVTSDSVVEPSSPLPTSNTSYPDLPVDPAPSESPSHPPDELPLPQSSMASPVTPEGDLDVPGGTSPQTAQDQTFPSKAALTAPDQATPSKRVITSKVTVAILPHTTILGEVFLTEDVVVSSQALPEPQATTPNASLAGGASSHRRRGTTFIPIGVVVAFSLALWTT